MTHIHTIKPTKGTCGHGLVVEQCPDCRARLRDRALALAERYEKDAPDRAERLLELAGDYDG